MASAATVFVATAAFAAPQLPAGQSFFKTPHGLGIIATRNHGVNQPVHEVRTPAVAWNNFNRDAKARYVPFTGSFIGCFSSTFCGSSATAVAFTGDGNVHKKIEVALGTEDCTGTGCNADVAIYSDSGSNTPGTRIDGSVVTATSSFSCCSTLTAALASHPVLAAGTQYWVVLTTQGSEPNALFLPSQDNDYINFHLISQYSGGAWNSYYTDWSYFASEVK